MVLGTRGTNLLSPQRFHNIARRGENDPSAAFIVTWSQVARRTYDLVQP